MKRSTGILVTAVLAVLFAVLLTLFVVRVAQEPGGAVRLGTDVFTLGSPPDVRRQIREGGPLVFADPNERGKVVVVALDGTRVVAFDAALGRGCVLEVDRRSRALRNSCTDAVVDPATVETTHYRVFTDDGDLNVDLNREVSAPEG